MPIAAGEPLHRGWTAAAVDALQMSSNPNVKVGIVYIRDSGTILLELTNDEGKVRSKSRVSYTMMGLPGCAISVDSRRRLSCFVACLVASAK